MLAIKTIRPISEKSSTSALGVKDGDIIAFAGTDKVSRFIEAVTFGPIHHIGIISTLHGEPLIYEAIASDKTRPPCCRQGKALAGVQAHYLRDILDSAKKCSIYHIPLRRQLYEHERERLSYYLDSKLGTPYDRVGAEESGGILFRQLESLFRPENLSKLFCSELVISALIDIGIFRSISASKWNPNAACRALRWQGITDRKRLIRKNK